MLEAFRAHLTGWPVKIMLGLLIAAFAIWGIGDVFRRGFSGHAVATVGSQEITQAELQQAFEQNYRDLQQRFGGSVDRQQAMQLGLMQQSLQELVAQHLVAAHAHDLNLAIPDAMLAESIRQNPLFQGASGFDRERVALVARSMGMSEDGYLAAFRDDMLRRELLRGLADPVVAPDVMARQLWLRDNEKRSGRALVVLADAISVEDPDEAKLAAYLEANEDQWQRPEYRRFTVVALRPADFAADEQVTEEEARAEYDARSGDFQVPEQREVTQLLAPDETLARQAVDLLKAGKSLEDAAKQLSSDGVSVENLGAMRRDQLPGALADAIFGLPAKGAVSEPVKSAFGWHIFRLGDIVPAATVPFEAKRAELEQEVKLRKAADRLPDLVNKLEDAIAGGEALEAAAGAAGAAPRAVETIDRQGNDRSGKTILDQTVTAAVVETAFGTSEGEVSPVKDTPDGGYYVVRVDKVEPAVTKPLEEVRSDLIAAWKASQQTEQASRTAKDLLTRAQGGEALEQLQATTPGTELRSIPAIDRTNPGTDAKISAAAVAQLFATMEGKIADESVAVPGGTAIVATDRIERPEPPADLGSLKSQVSADLRNDLLGQYEEALRARYQPTVNQRALGALMRPQEN